VSHSAKSHLRIHRCLQSTSSRSTQDPIGTPSQSDPKRVAVDIPSCTCRWIARQRQYSSASARQSSGHTSVFDRQWSRSNHQRELNYNDMKTPLEADLYDLGPTSRSFYALAIVLISYTGPPPLRQYAPWPHSFTRKFNARRRVLRSSRRS